MIPIQDLINRIKLDEEFGKGHFEMSYYDRILDSIIRVPFKEIKFELGDHFSFEITNHEEEAHAQSENGL